MEEGGRKEGAKRQGRGREGGRKEMGETGIRELRRSVCLLDSVAFFVRFVLILFSVGVRVIVFGSCFVLFPKLSAFVSRSGQATAY